MKALYKMLAFYSLWNINTSILLAAIVLKNKYIFTIKGFFFFPFMDIIWYNAVWDHFSDSIQCVSEEGRQNAYQLTTGTENNLVDTNTHSKLEQLLKWSFSCVWCTHVCSCMWCLQRAEAGIRTLELELSCHSQHGLLVTAAVQSP